MSYDFLKSGTDIRGVASDIFSSEVTLTNEAVYDIVAAFVCWLTDKYEISAEDMKISVGHDSRISADRISSVTKDALVTSGVCVYDCGLSSTPAMFMTTVNTECIAAVQITASHHPADRNGLKFFTREGGLDGSDIKKIITLANDKTSYIPSAQGKINKIDFMSDYSKQLRQMICKGLNKSEEEQPLKGYHFVVDAGNGAGGFYANDVLKPLGANIDGSQFLEPDGMFPNHIPNPENKEAMESICSAVIKNNADFGIIFDTDVDRAGCVDSFGNEINRNRLVALASSIVAKDNKGCTIVTDSITSDGLKEFIENDLSCIHYRYRRGYKNVINKAIELCERGINCPLAIETSGHAALKENYFLDDGAYFVTKIVIEIAKGNNPVEVVSKLKMPLEEKEIRFNILCDDFKTYGEQIIKELEEFSAAHPNWKVADDSREGVRVSTGNGWFLFRLSVHDPVIPANFESNVEGGIVSVVDELMPLLKKFDKLDISAIL